MAELRWNPLLGTWTIVAAKRQQRPNLKEDYCPFCPKDNPALPKNYEVFMYPNDFPALSDGYNGSLGIIEDGFYQKASAKGNCEVILYSSDHHLQLHQLSDTHIEKLMQLWKERFSFYKQKKLIQYVFEFENRGKEVGVTMYHPHGQLYAFPYVPQKIEQELSQSEKYFQEKGTHLFDEMIKAEKSDGRRIIFETANFIVFLPYFTDYPYGIFIVSKIPILFIDELNTSQLAELGKVIRDVCGMFDNLYGQTFPYMMCMHQGVINNVKWADQKDFYRFHIEYYPPLRAKGVVKYYASAETGAWAATNPRLVEETALELKTALEKYRSK
ncbi:MAG: galactose-1-phosphate uridylyltransferase [Chitinophagales bacterium]|nr:galactose-1-phosphate uridylyltransferase [Chitinophagales bacterium]